MVPGGVSGLIEEGVVVRQPEVLERGEIESDCTTGFGYRTGSC